MGCSSCCGVATERIATVVGTERDVSRRWFIGLLLALGAALPLLLWWGRDQWFFFDEWEFLVNRRAGDVSSLFEPHNGHWMTVPLILYRINDRLFGLDSYLPYQLPLVVVHLGVVALCWLIMRRLGVRPIIATATVLPFVFFGAGATNIFFAFTIGLTGSLFCGLAHLLLADHDGPVDRRDVLGLAFGVVALMCSAVGVALIVGVTVAVLLRRGWRPAVLHSVPLGVVYLAWYAAFGSDGRATSYSFGSDTMEFVVGMARGTFAGLGHYGLVAVALVALAAVGWATCINRARVDHRLAPVSLVAGLTVGFVAFASFTAIARAVFGVESASEPRYIYVAAALFLPVVALGAQALTRRWVGFGAAPLVLLAIGLPTNIDLLVNRDPIELGEHDQVAAAAHSDLLPQLPADTRLFTTPFAPEFGPTAGWLRAAAAEGRISEPQNPTGSLLADADAQIALRQAGRATSDRACPLRPSPLTARLDRGDRIVFSGSITVVVARGDRRSWPRQYSSPGGAVEIRAGPVDVEIRGLGHQPPAVCNIERSRLDGDIPRRAVRLTHAITVGSGGASFS
jgi:hypothetical protein